MNPARLLSSQKIWNAIRYLDPDLSENGISGKSSVDTSAFGSRVASTRLIFACAVIPEPRLPYFSLYARKGVQAALRGLLHIGTLFTGAMKGPR